MNKIFSLALLSAAVLFLFPVAYAAEPQPGDACPEANRFMRSGGLETSGKAYFMTCQGGVWVRIAESDTGGNLGVKQATPKAPLHVGGEAIIGETTGLACDADREGGIRYNNTSDELEYCDGTAWASIAPAAGGNCSNPGELCADGTLYAGLTCDVSLITASAGTCVPIYVPPRDQSTSAYWGTYGFTTGSTSETDGTGNQADIYAHVMAGDGSYNPDNGRTPNAFVLCNDLTYGGHSDWYLPAKDELNVLYGNKGVIGGFGNGVYWSSTENDLDYAWYQSFSDGNQSSTSKVATYAVRCVRKD